MAIVPILVGLLVFCLLWWGVTRILAAFGVGDPIATVVRVVLVVIFVLWLLSAFGLGTGIRFR